MSAVTLDTLRADYDAARVGVRHWESEEHSGETIDDAAFYSMTASAGIVDGELPVLRAAAIYVIARDYSLQAAMAYKLSDGLMDPRKAGQA